MNTEIPNAKGTQNLSARFQGKPFRIEWSRAARRALQPIQGPLLVEMELYSGCLIREQMGFFDEDAEKRFDPVTDEVSLAFRPVVTQACGIDEDRPPPVEDFAIQLELAFIPRWLHLHHRNDAWEGTFGY